jgi:hypothetical protein
MENLFNLDAFGKNIGGMLVMNRVICLIVFLLCFVQSVQGYLVPLFQIEQLVESSDFIGICQAEQVTTVDPKPEKQGEFTAECKVLATLKGENMESITVLTFLGDTNRRNKGFRCLKKGDIAVLFLKHEKQNTFDFANKYHPKIPLFKFYEEQSVATNNIQKRISSQLMQALESDNPEEVTSAIFWLTETKEDIPQDKLLEFSKSENKDLRVASLRRLIRYKNKAAIRDASLWLLTPDINTKLTESQLYDFAWPLALEATSVDLGLANKLASSSNKIVQRIGVCILKEIGDNSSIPILIEALEAKNIETQRSAYIALSRITGYKGTVWDEFWKNPSADIQKWKNWWQEKNKKKSESELSSGSKSNVTNSIKSNVSK